MSLTQTSEKSKRIASNTGAIYIRMIVVMLATLYTSRIVLQQLGVIDFGINNVVAGIVSLLAFFSSSLSNAAQRYLSIGLGENNTSKTRLYFRQSLQFDGDILCSNLHTCRNCRSVDGLHPGCRFQHQDWMQQYGPTTLL